jgi:hypothetical protein
MMTRCAKPEWYFASLAHLGYFVSLTKINAAVHGSWFYYYLGTGGVVGPGVRSIDDRVKIGEPIAPEDPVKAPDELNLPRGSAARRRMRQCEPRT